jgi:tetratricopeptide (TPR) repeat protein
MKRAHFWLSMPMLTLGLILVTKVASQNVLDHNHKISLNGLNIDVSKEDTDRWRKRLTRVTQAQVAQVELEEKVRSLAKGFGLMEKTRLNPHLVFENEDISYWQKQRLSARSLELEFAARKLILELADKQQVKINNKEQLAEAARQIIPILQEESSPTIPDTSEIACDGDTSAKFISQSWNSLETGKLEKALACTNRAIGRWTRQADEQQTRAAKEGCNTPPKPEDLKAYFSSTWALSDIATSWFIRGEVLSQQRRWAEAREAYKMVIDKYPCAYTWDTRGWFWRTADAAQEKFDEIRRK